MKFYLFNPDFKLLSEMEEAGVVGNLFTYDTKQSDFFTKIARDIDVHKKIKYMVAIRPHVLSPEYLVKIHKSIKEIAKEDRLQINLISGKINAEEQEIIRTLGKITNKSTTIERSNHLIEYIELLNQLPQREKPDYYVSVTNDFTFETASKYNNKMIVPYHQYMNNKYDVTDKKIMIYLTPIIRKTQKELDNIEGYEVQNIEDIKFTHDSMTSLVDKLQNEGIKEIIFSAWNIEDIRKNLDFVKEYNYSKRGNQ
jgi:hypothetical protein